MYGKDCRDRPCGPDAAALLRADAPELRRRAAVGLSVLLDMAVVDSSRVGANGYCFGGTVVLEMARAGMELSGVVSFHGGLEPLAADSTIPAGTAVQIHTGDLDPITENDLGDMMDEMRDAGLGYWAAFVYGNSAHGWTDPVRRTFGAALVRVCHLSVCSQNSAAYREREGTEAHEIMFSFYSDTFGPAGQPSNALPANISAAHRAALGTTLHAGAADKQPEVNRLEELCFGIAMGFVVGGMAGFGARRSGWGAAKQPKYARAGLLEAEG